MDELSEVIKQNEETDEELYKKIYNFVAQELRPLLIKPKTPIYSMGSPDPRAFTTSYNSFSGIDVKVSIDDEVDGTVQGISFYYKVNDSGEIEGYGSLVKVIFDYNNDLPGRLIGKTCRLSAVAAGEDNKTWTYFDREVKFIEYGSGCSVDDIIMEESYTFKIIGPPEVDE